MTSRAFIAILSAILLAPRLLAPLLHAQTALPEQVAGKIVSARDGHPLVHAAVSLEGHGTHATTVTVFTAEDGSFRFNPVPPGKYTLQGSAAGYIASAYLEHDGFSTAIVTGAGLATGALQLALSPAAAISGHILDETGEPISGSVALYREVPAGHITQFRAQGTGGDGNYEFPNLPPGRYFLAANASPWYAVHPMSVPADQPVPYRTAVDPALDVAYPTVFYPNALTSDGASPLTLRGGEDIVANLQMAPQHAVTLTLAGTPKTGQPQLYPQLTRSVFGSPEPVPAQMIVIDGVQQLIGIPPGQYTVQQVAQGGSFPVQAAQVDLTTGSVTLTPAPTPVLATVNAAVKATVKATPGAAPNQPLQLNLTPIDHAPNRGPVVTSTAGEHDTFNFPAVPPGDYRLTLYAAGRLLPIAGLSVDGHRVPGHLLHVPGADPLQVTLTPGGAPITVEGFARRDGKPGPAALVLLVPAGEDTSEDLFRRDQSDLDGSFTFANVMPGNYIVVALDDAWTLPWSDLAALAPYLLHGIPLTIPGDTSATFHLPRPIVTQPR